MCVARLGDREPDEQARIADMFVALRDLGVGQRRATAWTVGGDLVVLFEQASFMQLLERPPHRLDVVGRHRPVRVRHVDPEPDALGQTFELADVSLDRRPTPLVERADAVALDVALAGRPDLLLDLDLDGQSMTVPATFPGNQVSGYRLVARVHV